MMTANQGMPQYQLPQAQGGGSQGGDPATPPWLSGITDLLNLGGSAYGLSQSVGLSGAANQVFNQSNPFGMYRPGYGADLLSLMQNPSSVSSLPGYKFLMDQGVQAIDRSAAGPGGVGLGSGGEMTELMQFGQGLADQFYQQQIQTLAGLAGSGISPSTPFQGLQGMGGAATSTGQSITGLAKDIRQGYNIYNDFFGGGGTTADIASGWGSTASQIGDLSGLNAGSFDYGALMGGSGASDAVDLTGLFSGPSAAGGGAAGAGAGAAGIGAGVGVTGGVEAIGAGVNTLAASDLTGASLLPSTEAAFSGASAGSGAAASTGLSAGAGGAIAVAAPLAVAYMGMSSQPYTQSADWWSKFKTSLTQGTSGNANFDKYDSPATQEYRARQTLYNMLLSGPTHNDFGQAGQGLPPEFMQLAKSYGMLNPDGSINRKWSPGPAPWIGGTGGGGGGGSIKPS